MAQPETIYRVITEGDCEGKTMHELGYATGRIEDIREYYREQKMYNFTITPITVVAVTPQMITERNQLVAERQSLEQAIKRVETRLAKMGARER